jgi:hypothetical protein
MRGSKSSLPDLKKEAAFQIKGSFKKLSDPYSLQIPGFTIVKFEAMKNKLNNRNHFLGSLIAKGQTTETGFKIQPNLLLMKITGFY